MSSQAASDHARLRSRLLAWYDANKRELPWRGARDPYAVWVSEIMLQQTRVETVIPYYARFMNKFPTTAALAEAPLDDVLSLWAGLGYYRRARMLHAGARAVHERGARRAPRTRDEWLDVPGVGKYTAGAIASIAFGERAPLVDGNVIRVLTRLYGMADDVKKAGTQRAIWAHAERIVDDKRPGDFNQALMELGATVCAPKTPACAACPWMNMCVARKQGDPEAYPRGKTANKAPIEHTAAFVLSSGTRVLLAQRVESARYGGMWEPPMLILPKAPTLATARKVIVWDVAGLHKSGEVTHILSHRRVVARVFSGTVAAVPKTLPAPYERARLVPIDSADGQWDGLALSTLARRVLSASDST